MTVQDATRTVTLPRQAQPAERPLATEPPAAVVAAPLLGRDRPLTADEREFALGLVAILVLLGSFIVAGLLLAQYVWS